MKVIGLTGGIGSGKTFVAGFFRNLGIPVYDSDVEAKILMNESADVRKAIVDLLGKKAYNKDALDRSYVSEKVFGNKELLNNLNDIVHPAVKEHFFEWCKKQDTPYVIQETALIFERDLQDRYDFIILVTAPKDLRIKRVLARDHQSKQQIVERMSHQWDDEKKKQLSDFEIVNIESEDTLEQVQKIHESILKLSREC